MFEQLDRLNRGLELAIELVAEWPRVKRIALVLFLRRLADRVDQLP